MRPRHVTVCMSPQNFVVVEKKKKFSKKKEEIFCKYSTKKESKLISRAPQSVFRVQQKGGREKKIWISRARGGATLRRVLCLWCDIVNKQKNRALNTHAKTFGLLPAQCFKAKGPACSWASWSEQKSLFANER